MLQTATSVENECKSLSLDDLLSLARHDDIDEITKALESQTYEQSILDQFFNQLWHEFSQNSNKNTKKILSYLLSTQKINNLPLTKEFYNTFYVEIISNPKNSKSLFSTKKLSIILSPGDGMENNFTPSLLNATEGVHLDKDFFPKKQELNLAKSKIKKYNLAKRLHNYTFEMILGRTVIFKNNGRERWLALKIKKPLELMS